MNPIIKLIKHLKKHGWRKTSEKMKYNYIMLETPESAIKKEIISFIGIMFGVTFAVVVFINRESWHLVIIMLFTLLLLWTQLKGKLKQLQTLKDIKKQFEEGE